MTWPGRPLRRLADCLDHVRIPLNAQERATRPGCVPYWGANTVQGYVDGFLINSEVVLLGEDGAPFFDRDRPVAFRVVGPIWPNNHIHVLKPNAGVDARWLAYALNDVDYSLYVGGSTRDKLTQSAMMQIAIPTPPHETQAAIADYLDHETAKIDTLIAKQEALIGTLKMRASATVDALTTGLDGPQVRLKFLFAPSLETSSLGDEVLSVFRDYGVVPKASRDGNFNRTPEDLSRYLAVRPGDLVVNKMKAWQGSLGISNHSGIVSGDYEVARPISTDLDPTFAHTLLRSPRMVSEFASRSTGIRPSQWRLYWNQLGNVRVPLPHLEVQRQVARNIDQQLANIEFLAAKAESFIRLAKEHRAALITAVVTGQVSPRT